MKNNIKIYGIDVGKDKLDVFESYHEAEQYYQIPNTTLAIVQWIKELPIDNVLFVLEPTGRYSDKLLYYLSQRNLPVNLVNPSQSNGFAKAMGVISKNDRQAACALALMGRSLDLPLYKAPSWEMQRRKQLLAGISALKKQRQMLNNQLHALESGILYEPKVLKAFEQSKETIEKQLQVLEEELNDLSDEESKQQLELMKTVVGIGPTTAHLLLSSTGGLHNFKYARQLSKFVGVVPWSHESGSSIRRKGRITRKGCNALRASLYMAARSAAKYNLACKDLYERLRKLGKPYKQAMVAVMNKLLKQAFGVVRSGKSFDNEFYTKFAEN